MSLPIKNRNRTRSPVTVRLTLSRWRWEVNGRERDSIGFAQRGNIDSCFGILRTDNVVKYLADVPLQCCHIDGRNLRASALLKTTKTKVKNDRVQGHTLCTVSSSISAIHRKFQLLHSTITSRKMG